MQAVLTRALALAIGLLGFLAAAPMAYAVGAVITNHSGTICKSSSPGEATLIEHSANGTRSVKTSRTSVICPLTRNASQNFGSYVYVDVAHTSTQTTTCTAYSFSYTGSLRASQTQTWSGSGFHEFVFNLVGPYKSDAWSDYSVFCSIPGNRNGVIYGVDLNEQPD
jgi:hypothetical protein